jgi:hypothetical protein
VKTFDGASVAFRYMRSGEPLGDLAPLGFPHRNNLGNAYALNSLRISGDGAPLLQQLVDVALSSDSELLSSDN